MAPEPLVKVSAGRAMERSGAIDVGDQQDKEKASQKSGNHATTEFKSLPQGNVGEYRLPERVEHLKNGDLKMSIGDAVHIRLITKDPKMRLEAIERARQHAPACQRAWERDQKLRQLARDRKANEKANEKAAEPASSTTTRDSAARSVNASTFNDIPLNENANVNLENPREFHLRTLAQDKKASKEAVDPTARSVNAFAFQNAHSNTVSNANLRPPHEIHLQDTAIKFFKVASPSRNQDILPLPSSNNIPISAGRSTLLPPTTTEPTAQRADPSLTMQSQGNNGMMDSSDDELSSLSSLSMEDEQNTRLDSSLTERRPVHTATATLRNDSSGTMGAGMPASSLPAQAPMMRDHSFSTRPSRRAAIAATVALTKKGKGKPVASAVQAPAPPPTPSAPPPATPPPRPRPTTFFTPDGTWVEPPVINDHMFARPSQTKLRKSQREAVEQIRARDPTYNPHAPEAVAEQEERYKMRLEQAMVNYPPSNVRGVQTDEEERRKRAVQVEIEHAMKGLAAEDRAEAEAPIERDRSDVQMTGTTIPLESQRGRSAASQNVTPNQEIVPRRPDTPRPFLGGDGAGLECDSSPENDSSGRIQPDTPRSFNNDFAERLGAHLQLNLDGDGDAAYAGTSHDGAETSAISTNTASRRVLRPIPPSRLVASTRAPQHRPSPPHIMPAPPLPADIDPELRAIAQVLIAQIDADNAARQDAYDNTHNSDVDPFITPGTWHPGPPILRRSEALAMSEQDFDEYMAAMVQHYVVTPRAAAARDGETPGGIWPRYRTNMRVMAGVEHGQPMPRREGEWVFVPRGGGPAQSSGQYGQNGEYGH